MTATAVATAKKRTPTTALAAKPAPAPAPAPKKIVKKTSAPPAPSPRPSQKEGGQTTAGRKTFCGDAELGVRHVIIWLARQKRALTRTQIQQAVKRALGFEPNINTTGECIRPVNLDNKKIEIRMPSEYGQKLLQAARAVVPSA